MEELLNNGIVQGVAVALIVAFFAWGVRLIRFRLDEKKIVDEIANSEFTFRSTEALASATDLSKARVERVCSKSYRIKRNEKTRETWRLD